jgi:mannose-6-phosphate isomerase-like protein (cupin superfamily)
MTQLKLVEAGQGEHYWMLGLLATIKAGGDDTDGLMTIAEFEAPPGWAVPPHVHPDDDELYYVLDGEISVWCAGEEHVITDGGMVWLPRKRPHSFHVLGTTPARLFNIHTGPQFDGLIRTLGEPATEPRLPDPLGTMPDPAVLSRTFAQFGVELVHVQNTD